MRISVNIAAALTVALAATSCGGPAEGPEASRNGNDPVRDAGARCVEYYSPETLRNRAFAFDGIVVSIRLRRDPKLDVPEEEHVRIPWVTFSVNRWYRGGSGQHVGVWIEHLNVTSSVGTISAERGTRLLVAGEPRWGGRPLDDPIAWACGFTQPYTPETAAQWKSTLLDRGSE